jgi:hypothetical protein
MLTAFMVTVPLTATGAVHGFGHLPHGHAGAEIWAMLWCAFVYVLLLLGGAMTLTVLVNSPATAAGGLDGVAGPVQVYEHNMFGTPGARLQQAAARGQVSHQQANAGIAGEQASASLLQTVLAMPGAKLLHSLPWPGRPKADVDHAVVCGRAVALIDSKLWQAGTYDVSNRGSVCCNGQPVRDKRVRIAAAVGAWRRVLPAGTRVAGFVLAHPGGDGAVRFTNTHAGGVRLCTGQDAAEAIGAFLLPEAGRVDRRVLYRLFTDEQGAARAPAGVRRWVFGPLGWLRAHYGVR